MLVAVVLALGNFSFGASSSVKKTNVEEAKRVSEAAAQIANRCYDTVDFGTVFDEFFVNEAQRRRRTAETFLSADIAPELLARVDDRLLNRAFVSVMNVVYL